MKKTRQVDLWNVYLNGRATNFDAAWKEVEEVRKKRDVEIAKLAISGSHSLSHEKAGSEEDPRSSSTTATVSEVKYLSSSSVVLPQNLKPQTPINSKMDGGAYATITQDIVPASTEEEVNK